MMTTGAANELRVWERAKNVWHDYTAQTGLSNDRIGSALAEDRHGNVWIGTSSDHRDSALIRYRRGEFRILAQSAETPAGWITDLYVDSRGRLWVAATENGLFRLDETDSDRFDFVRYTSAEGLTSDTIIAVTIRFPASSVMVWFSE